MEEQAEQQRGGQTGGPPPLPTAPTAPSTSASNASFSTYGGFLNGQNAQQGLSGSLNVNYANTSLGWLRDKQPGIGGANNALKPTATTLAASSSTSFSPTTLAQNTLPSSLAPTSSLDNYAANAPFTFPASSPLLPTHTASNGNGGGNDLSPAPAAENGNSSQPKDVENHWARKGSAGDKERALNAPSTSFQSHTRPAHASQPSSNLPTKNGPPSLLALTTTANIKPPGPSLPGTSAIAPTNPTPSASGTAGTPHGSNAQNGTSSDSPTTVPAPVVGGQQPSANRPSEGSGGVSSSKPVLKMKRTGQLASPASIHQRNSSYSPIRKLGQIYPNAAARNSSVDLVPNKAAGSPLTGRQPNAQPPKPSVGKGVERHPGVGLFNKSNGTSTTEAQPFPRLNGAGGPTGLLPKATQVPKTKGSGSTRMFSASSNESDDEIMYETAARPQDLIAEGGPVNDSSSGDSGSESEDDETVENPTGEKSFRQLFRAPDQESDVYDEEESDEDDTTSVSSSEGSSIAMEPSVALPSANIQEQEAYPATILTMANPNRSYCTWLGT